MEAASSCRCTRSLCEQYPLWLGLAVVDRPSGVYTLAVPQSPAPTPLPPSLWSLSRLRQYIDSLPGRCRRCNICGHVYHCVVAVVAAAALRKCSAALICAHSCYIPGAESSFLQFSMCYTLLQHRFWRPSLPHHGIARTCCVYRRVQYGPGSRSDVHGAPRRLPRI